MSKHITNLRSIGYENIWKILHEINTCDPNALPKINKKISVNLLLAEDSQDLQKMYTQTLTKLGLELKCFSPDQWEFDRETAQIKNFKEINSADLQIVCGLPQIDLDYFCEQIKGSVFNASNDDGNLCALFGDIALLYELTPGLDKIRISWVGGSTPLANSLVEASIFVPFELFMALPVDKEPNRDLIGFALSAGAKIFLTRDVNIATDETHYIYFGDIATKNDKNSLNRTFNPIDYIKNSIADHALENVKFLRGAAASAPGQIDLSWVKEQDNLSEKQVYGEMKAQICLLSWLLNE